MPISKREPQIPMFNGYVEIFGVAGPQAATGRKGWLFLEICRQKDISRKQFAADFDIRPSTVSSLVMQLIEDGLVEEIRPTASRQKGRPEILLQPVVSRLCVIVFYVVSQTIHAILVDLGGNILSSESEEVYSEKIQNENLKSLFSNMVKRLHTAAPAKSTIVGISVSLPGIVDEAKKKWIFASSRWPNIRNLNLSDLGSELDLDVYVNKNLNCELRARVDRRGEADGKNILFLHWGHGVGAAMSLNGTILTSGNGGFGEIGHTYVHCANDIKCRCGLKNCLETQAALWALLPALQKKYPNIPGDEWSFETFIKGDSGFVTVHLHDSIRFIAEAMRNLALVFSPHEIVLTGPFVQHPEIFERLENRFREILPTDSQLFPYDDIIVAAARAGTEDEIIGAAFPLFARKLKELCDMPTGQRIGS